MRWECAGKVSPPILPRDVYKRQEYINYKKYKCPDVCAELLEKGHYHYFGPSKASLDVYKRQDQNRT